MNPVNQTVMLEFSQAGAPSQTEYMRRNANAMVNALSQLAENTCLVAAGAAIATVTSQVKIVTASVLYKIQGLFKTKGITDNFWTLVGAVAPVSTFTKYLLLVDAAGVASVVACTSAATAALSLLPIGTNLGNKSVFATLTVATNAATTFTPGVTLLGAAGITATIADGFDITVLPWAYTLLLGLTPAGSGF